MAQSWIWSSQITIKKAIFKSPNNKKSRKARNETFLNSQHYFVAGSLIPISKSSSFVLLAPLAKNISIIRFKIKTTFPFSWGTSRKRYGSFSYMGFNYSLSKICTAHRYFVILNAH